MNPPPNTEKAPDKQYIASQIKPITLDQVDKEFAQLVQIGTQAGTMSERSKVGNNVVDYFTFVQRLDTRGKYNVTFFEFVEQLDTFREKKFIQHMLDYYKKVKNKNNTKNQYVVYKEVYNICISAINIMRPLCCMELFTRFNAKRVLNFCAGWGGSCVAAAALKLDAHYGLDINASLTEPYHALLTYLGRQSNTHMQMTICDATLFDYSTIEYDTVFSSPPYYFIEKYEHNTAYESKADMDARFYTPVFTNSYAHLKPGGHFIINVCKEVYDNVLTKLFGNAHMTIPLKKSKRQNNHTELIYMWHKA